MFGLVTGSPFPVPGVVSVISVSYISQVQIDLLDLKFLCMKGVQYAVAMGLRVVAIGMEINLHSPLIVWDWISGQIPVTQRRSFV